MWDRRDDKRVKGGSGPDVGWAGVCWKGRKQYNCLSFHHFSLSFFTSLLLPTIPCVLSGVGSSRRNNRLSWTLYPPGTWGWLAPPLRHPFLWHLTSDLFC